MIRKNSTTKRFLTMKATGKFDGYLTLFGKVMEKLRKN